MVGTVGLMAWRVAKALDTLLVQINGIAPGRSKLSDGSIGDAAHASRSSDHNPWVKDGAMGVVTARDYTHDPGHGADMHAISEALRSARDPRIKYVIWNRRSFSLASPAWAWRPYGGSNPHDKHMHVSVQSSKGSYDSTAPWAVGGPAREWVLGDREIVAGAQGGDVGQWQTLLRLYVDVAIVVDGDYGPATQAATARYQTSSHLAADGMVGALTMAAMRATSTGGLSMADVNTILAELARLNDRITRLDVKVDQAKAAAELANWVSYEPYPGGLVRSLQAFDLTRGRLGEAIDRATRTIVDACEAAHAPPEPPVVVGDPPDTAA